MIRFTMLEVGLLREVTTIIMIGLNLLVEIGEGIGIRVCLSPALRILVGAITVGR